MAQLMFKIANQPHPDIRTLRPDVPDCLANVIDRALLKDPEQRYQNGHEMAEELKVCSASLASSPSAGSTVDIDL